MLEYTYLKRSIHQFVKIMPKPGLPRFDFPRQFLPAIQFSNNPRLFLDGRGDIGMVCRSPMHACGTPAPFFSLRCLCSRMESSAWIENESDSQTGTVQKPTKPACTPDPATAIVSPSRLDPLWKHAGFLHPATTGTSPSTTSFRVTGIPLLNSATSPNFNYCI